MPDGKSTVVAVLGLPHHADDELASDFCLFHKVLDRTGKQEAWAHMRQPSRGHSPIIHGLLYRNPRHFRAPVGSGDIGDPSFMSLQTAADQTVSGNRDLIIIVAPGVIYTVIGNEFVSRNTLDMVLTGISSGVEITNSRCSRIWGISFTNPRAITRTTAKRESFALPTSSGGFSRGETLVN